MKDFLQSLYKQYGFDHNFVRQVASGKRYFAIELVNGNIGVCATLGSRISERLPQWINPELENHRIILTAYYNALLNYRSENIVKAGDITQGVDLRKYRRIHVIGKFEPVFERFRQMDIKFTFSDLREPEHPDNKLKHQKTLVRQSDCLIMSATTLYNGTFEELIELAPKADKFLLGPSSILSPELCYWGVKGSFGVQFKPYDSRVMGLIAMDYGTRYFLKRGEKVALLCDIIHDR